jgi:Ni,Fe-hydrogenase I cytochrome b subunit
MSIVKFLAAIDPADVNVPEVEADVIFKGAMDIVFFAASATAVIVIIVAGFYLVFSSGTPESTRKAKDMILYGVIGLVVVIMAFTITQFIIGRF